MIKALIPIISLLMGAGSVQGAEETFVDKYYAWEYACTLQQEFSCIGVTPPKIMLKDMGPDQHGLFKGGTTVYINPTTREPGSELYRATLVHEMVHYLDFKKGELFFGPWNVREVCRSENLAFAMSDAYLDMVGQPSFKRGATWWKKYWHCEPQYNPDFEVWDWLQRRPR